MQKRSYFGFLKIEKTSFWPHFGPLLDQTLHNKIFPQKCNSMETNPEKFHALIFDKT